MSVRNTTLILFYAVLLLLLSLNLIAQDTTDSLKVIVSSSFDRSSMCEEYSIRRYPTKNDSLISQKIRHLVSAQPSQQNYYDYFLLASAFWNLGYLTESEVMFLEIFNSKESFYTTTYRGSSDLPGDTSTNTYGYGSFTYNFKNQACLFLTKIYLEKKKFDQALSYAKLADKKYAVSYSCGTGARFYRNQIQGLYSLCYYGLGMYDLIIENYISSYYDFYAGILVKSIRNKYTKGQIDEFLITAENSISFRIDKNPNYVGESAIIKLFGKTVKMPEPSLENGEVASRELFLKEFKESGFYKRLTE